MTLVVWAAAAMLVGFAGAIHMLAAGPDRIVGPGPPDTVVAVDFPPAPVRVSGAVPAIQVAADGVALPPRPAPPESLLSVRMAVASAFRDRPGPGDDAATPEPVALRTAPIGRPDARSPGNAAMEPWSAGLTDSAPVPPLAARRVVPVAGPVRHDSPSPVVAETPAESAIQDMAAAAAILPTKADALSDLDFDRGGPLPEPRIVPPAGTVLTLAAVGDIMLGGSVKHDPRVPLPLPLDSRVADMLRRADLAVGNLEGVIGGATLTARGCGGTCYRFRMQPSAATVLADAGFDLLSLANNHADDFGIAGRSATRRALDGAGIGYAGHDENRHRVTARWVRDLTVGFVGFGHNLCCLDLRDLDAAAAIVADLHARHDIVIVMAHGGAEGVRHQRLPRGRESYLGIDRGSIFAFARRVVDAGADVVLGSGPHVPRALEVYRNRLIAYSLGNFWTTRNVSLAGPARLAPILQLWLAQDGAVLGFDIVSARQTRAHGPRLDPADAAWHRIRLLTRLDFPDQPLMPLVMAMSATAARPDDP